MSLDDHGHPWRTKHPEVAVLARLGLAYDDLLPHTVELSVAGSPVRVLDLAMIVMLKRKSTHPKDRLVLPILEETLRRLGRA